MKATLHCLMQLQSVDNKLQALEALKGDLPQQITKLKDELQGVRDRHERIKGALEASKKSRLHWEGEQKVLEEKLKKYQDQRYLVTSNKEYDAINIEIDTTKAKIEEADTKILEFMETEENLIEEEKNLASHIGILHDNLTLKEKELEEKIQVTEKESVSYENKRKELINTIQKPILYQYERIRKGLGNNAVAEIRNYACGGCFSAIPPQKAVEIKMMNQLIMCESCGRILVYKSEDEMVTS